MLTICETLRVRQSFEQTPARQRLIAVRICTPDGLQPAVHLPSGPGLQAAFAEEAGSMGRRFEVSWERAKAVHRAWTPGIRYAGGQGFGGAP